MEIRQLRYFLAVAETGHMTRAAKSLGIQQPPLSQQIKSLEAQLGMKLFNRHPKGMTLTDQGRLFRVEAQRMVESMLALERRMAIVAKGKAGTLAVGFTSSAAAHAFVPEALRACRRTHPDIALEIYENNAAEITESLESAKLHCGLLREPVARPENLEFLTLLREPVLVALPSDHRLASKDGQRNGHPISLDELREENFILVRRPGAPGMYSNLLEKCLELGFNPRVGAEVDRMMTNLNLIAAGAGVSIVPSSMKDVHKHAVVYRPLAQGQDFGAPLTLAYRREDFTGPTAIFVGLARQLAGSWTSD